MNPHIRLYEAEKLDDLSLSGQVLSKALKSLKLINHLFGNHRQLNKAVLNYCNQYPSRKIFRIVDLGCGGGDSIYFLQKKLSKKGIKAAFLGIDGNPETIKFASKENRCDHIQFITKDILDPNFDIPECDILISSHFIYHFEDTLLVSFLHQIQNSRIKHIIFSELYRSKKAYNLFKIAGYFLPISEMAKKDGALAIQRAFTPIEIKKIIRETKITDFLVKKKLWFRMIIIISP